MKSLPHRIWLLILGILVAVTIGLIGLVGSRYLPGEASKKPSSQLLSPKVLIQKMTELARPGLRLLQR